MWCERNTPCASLQQHSSSSSKKGCSRVLTLRQTRLEWVNWITWTLSTGEITAGWEKPDVSGSQTDTLQRIRHPHGYVFEGRFHHSLGQIERTRSPRSRVPSQVAWADEGYQPTKLRLFSLTCKSWASTRIRNHRDTTVPNMRLLRSFQTQSRTQGHVACACVIFGLPKSMKPWVSDSLRRQLPAA